MERNGLFVLLPLYRRYGGKLVDKVGSGMSSFSFAIFLLVFVKKINCN